MPLGEAQWPTKDASQGASVLPVGEPVSSVRHLDLEPLPELVGASRKFVAEQVPALSADSRDTLALLTSELVTNAIIHARTPLRVSVIVSPRYVAVTVQDQDLGHSELGAGSRDGGRGLSIVDLLADAWSIRKDGPDGGKTVWFRIVRDEGSGASSIPEKHREGDR